MRTIHITTVSGEFPEAYCGLSFEELDIRVARLLSPSAYKNNEYSSYERLCQPCGPCP
jgi:hypothetical protein